MKFARHLRGRGTRRLCSDEAGEAHHHHRHDARRHAMVTKIVRKMRENR